MVHAARASGLLQIRDLQPVNDVAFVFVKTDLALQVLAAVKTVVGPGPAALHAPQFAGNEWNYLKECLDSTFVSSVGKFVDRFERELADYTGAKHAVAVV